MLFRAGSGDRVEPLPDAALARRTAIAAGPGLGGGITDLRPEMRAWLEALWCNSPVPVVFDADALPSAVPSERRDRVLTPHPGEAGRLLGCSGADIQADRFSAASKLAARGVALLKGRHTLIAEADQPTSVNPTGASTLGTGGSGDVLTGVIGALLARGVGARDAARLGAFVHGRAGEMLAERRTEGWGATDIAQALPDAIEELLQS
jgi:NAD(P)H-hydrate epimerase